MLGCPIYVNESNTITDETLFQISINQSFIVCLHLVVMARLRIITCFIKKYYDMKCTLSLVHKKGKLPQIHRISCTLEVNK